MEFRIRVNDALARRRLNQAAKRSTDLRPVWADVNANVIQPAMLKRWDTAGSAFGSGWQELSPAGVRSRLNQRGGNRGGITRPLWDFGRLRGSWVKNGPESIVALKKMSLERGTSVPYAAPHQNGSGNLPARPMVTEPLKEHVGNEAGERIARFIVND